LKTITRALIATTKSVTPTLTTPTTPAVGLSVAQRAVTGVKDTIKKGVITPGTTIKIPHVAGSRANLEKAIELWKKYVHEVNEELITLGQESDVYTKAMQEAVTKTVHLILLQSSAPGSMT